MRGKRSSNATGEPEEMYEYRYKPIWRYASTDYINVPL